MSSLTVAWTPPAPSAVGCAPGRCQSNGGQAADDVQLAERNRRRAGATLEFLKCCYRFVTKQWPHEPREQLPDQGFELRFRERVRDLPDWRASDERELHLGTALNAASGTTHEVDIVALHSDSDIRVVVEMKNRGDPVGKNDVIVFFAKVIDYVLANPRLALDGICLVFMCRASFDPRGLAACLGLGIHPICSRIRPLPVLANTVDILVRTVSRGLQLPSELQTRLSDLRAEVSSMHVCLKDTWPADRLDYRSETTVSIRAVPPIERIDGLVDRFVRANATCTDILQAVQKASRVSKGVTP